MKPVLKLSLVLLLMLAVMGLPFVSMLNQLIQELKKK